MHGKLNCLYQSCNVVCIFKIFPFCILECHNSHSYESCMPYYDILYAPSCSITFHIANSLFFHFLGSFTWLSFYMAAPLSLCCNFVPDTYKFSVSRLSEFIVRGKNQMPPSEIDFWEIASPLLKLQLRQWIGAALVFWGWIHQRRCHAILVCITILTVINLFLEMFMQSNC